MESSDAYVDEIQPQDLTKFGLIPEFVGRMPIVVGLHALDETALVKIMTEPKNAIVKQTSLIHISEPTRQAVNSFAVHGLKKKITISKMSAIS